MSLTTTSPLVTEQQFVDTYRRADYANQALRFLKDRGIFPLSLSNPQLKPLNTLGAYIYLSGCLAIQNKKGSDAYSAYISNGPRPMQEFPLEEWQKTLGIVCEPNRESFYLSTNSAPYMRLLHILGFHTSTTPKGSDRKRKATAGSHLPPYLEDVLANPKAFSESVHRFSKPLLRDLVNAWVHTRSVIMSPRSMYITLPGQPSTVELSYQATLFERAMNIAFPEVELDKRQLRRYEGTNPKNRTFFGNFNISLEQMIALSRRGSTPLKLEFSARPQFSFQHPTSNAMQKEPRDINLE